MGHYLAFWGVPRAIAADPFCPTPVLSRLQRHRLTSADTLATLSQRYNLAPETLTRLNSTLQGGKIPVGQEILIPPMNGIRVNVPKGATWQDLAKAYGIRADVLFELNGCEKTPLTVVFIPGVNWQPGATSKPRDYIGLKGYPLSAPAPVGLSYGWHTHATGQSFFHSGLDLLAAVGTPVLAADSGQVLYAAQEGTYGLLVVIEHGNGRQTRYAHLSRLQAKIGQAVKVGEVIGYVGITGRPDITTPHLHFEVRYKLPVGWVAQDPAVHLPRQENKK